VARLKITEGAEQGRVFVLDKSPMLIGRYPSSDIRVPDLKASRKHAWVEKREDGFHIVDADSRNHTLVNGVEERDALLEEGDEITIGHTKFVFEESDAEGEEGLAVELVDEKKSRFVSVIESEVDVESVKLADGQLAASGAAKDTLEVLHRLLDAVISSRDADDLIEEAMDVAIRLSGADRGFISLSGEEPEDQVVRTSRPRPSEGFTVSISENILRHTIRRGTALLCSDVEHGGGMRRVQSAAYVPLKAGGRAQGMLGVYATGAERTLSEEALRYLVVLGNHLALALENLRLRQTAQRREMIEAELATAREIQSSLLPEQPAETAGLDYAATMVPAREVGGDLYDWLPLEDGRIAFAIGDVSGKGVPAALSMTRTMAFLRAHGASADDPSAVLKAVNHSLYERRAGKTFVSMAFMVFDPRSLELVVSGAGHPAPVIYRTRADAIEEISYRQGPILGVTADWDWPRVSFSFEPGDVAVFCTDGILEVQNAEGDRFETGKLQEIVQRSARLKAAGILDNILECVDDFMESRDLVDDMTLLVLKIKGT